MLKKIVLAAAVAVSASFATWDYFPVLESHKGQAKLEFGSEIQDPFTEFMVTGGVRFSPAQNFEFGIELPYTIFCLSDGSFQSWNGVRDLKTMFRYQFLPFMNAFLDITIPTANAYLYYPDYAFAFYFGTQFSKNFGLLNLGSEFGLYIETRGEDKTMPPQRLNLDAEADLAISQVFVPYAGFSLGMLIGKYRQEGHHVGNSYTGKFGIAPFAGFKVAFNDYVSLDVHGKIQLGEDYLGVTTPNHSDDALITAASAVYVNF